MYLNYLHSAVSIQPSVFLNCAAKVQLFFETTKFFYKKIIAHLFFLTVASAAAN